ncbi:MAG: threonylcarbamoyl-AMP synthase [Flavobacteriia bacterium]|nr:threonylcarbamoyl-AMP synthase [Flavobacteriia bacterium]
MQQKNEIVKKLQEGGVILYPTDTIWGLGCDATNEESCQKIHHIKNRPKSKNLIILVDSFLMLERYVPEFSEVCYQLADLAIKPLTIIYPKAKDLAPSVVAEDGSVGIRLTKDPICLELIKGLKKPLVSTSANLSGEHYPTCFNDVPDEIKNEVDAIIYERLDEIQVAPSQVIKIGLDGQIKILRK